MHPHGGPTLDLAVGRRRPPSLRRRLPPLSKFWEIWAQTPSASAPAARAATCEGCLCQGCQLDPVSARRAATARAPATTNTATIANTTTRRPSTAAVEHACPKRHDDTRVGRHGLQARNDVGEARVSCLGRRRSRRRPRWARTASLAGPRRRKGRHSGRGRRIICGRGRPGTCGGREFSGSGGRGRGSDAGVALNKRVHLDRRHFPRALKRDHAPSHAPHGQPLDSPPPQARSQHPVPPHPPTACGAPGGGASLDSTTHASWRIGPASPATAASAAAGSACALSALTAVGAASAAPRPWPRPLR